MKQVGKNNEYFIKKQHLEIKNNFNFKKITSKL